MIGRQCHNSATSVIHRGGGGGKWTSNSYVQVVLLSKRIFAILLLYLFSYGRIRNISIGLLASPPLAIQHPIHPRRNLLRHLLSMLDTKPMRHATFAHDHPRLPVLAPSSSARFDNRVSRCICNPRVAASEIEHQSRPARFLRAPDVGAPAVGGDLAHLVARQRECLKHGARRRQERERGCGRGPRLSRDVQNEKIQKTAGEDGECRGEV